MKTVYDAAAIEAALQARIKEYEDIMHKYLSENDGTITLNDVLKNKDGLSQYITDLNKQYPFRDRIKKQ